MHPAEDVIDENVRTIAALREQHERRIPAQYRAISWLSAAIGRPLLLWTELILLVCWLLLGRRWFDPPPNVWLQGVVGVASLLLTTMVLIAQNRERALSDRRAHLDTQLSLAVDQKVAKLIALVEELRKDLPIPDRADPVAESMARPTDPHEVSRRLERRLDPTDHDDAPDDAPETSHQ
jgi:uncharacterized membrane protein